MKGLGITIKQLIMYARKMTDSLLRIAKTEN